MRGLLAFIGARFGWDKSRASFIYTEAIYRCFKMELIYSDEIRWVHSVVWASVLTARAQEVVPCFWLE